MGKWQSRKPSERLRRLEGMIHVRAAAERNIRTAAEDKRSEKMQDIYRDREELSYMQNTLKDLSVSL